KKPPKRRNLHLVNNLRETLLINDNKVALQTKILVTLQPSSETPNPLEKQKKLTQEGVKKLSQQKKIPIKKRGSHKQRSKLNRIIDRIEGKKTALKNKTMVDRRSEVDVKEEIVIVNLIMNSTV